jgi:alkylhydroperoxidase family enzyme
VGEIRRLRYEELEASLQDVLRAKVERLGYLGEFFSVGGHQPTATAAFQSFTEALKQALPPELTEVVALSVAAVLDNEYERVQHERLSSSLGFSVAWIEAAVGLGDVSLLSESARVARELAVTMVSGHGRNAAAQLGRAVDVLGQEYAVGVLLTIGRYIAHAAISNTLQLKAPVTGVVGPNATVHPPGVVSGASGVAEPTEV